MCVPSSIVCVWILCRVYVDVLMCLFCVWMYGWMSLYCGYVCVDGCVCIVDVCEDCAVCLSVCVVGVRACVCINMDSSMSILLYG